MELDRAERRVVVRRLARRFASPEEAELAAIPVLDVLQPLDRAAHTLLMDVRQAPAISDPKYEQWYAEVRHRIVDGFARVAVVVRTASGRLQVARLAHQDQHDRTLAVFTSLAEAQVYLDRT